ncbi:MAG: DUF4394 domain-containing protein [Microcoleaceae cyanobacterium]
MSTQFFALTDDNTVVSFEMGNLSQTAEIPVTGLDGVLLGIDVRPATGEIYGITTANNIYTIDPDTGMAMLESMLDIPFEGGTISGFDFNPVADRLRLVGDNDQDFRINVDTGEVIVDGDLAFAAGDINAGVNPNITAAAYTNSFAGTTTTQLYDIDTLLNDLVLQDPPNDGTLVTIGDLGINFDTLGGFDILSSAEGMNEAFAVSNSMLYTVDLSTGMATSLGMIGSDSTLNLQGLAVIDDDPMIPMADPVTLSSILTGDQEVPTPGDADAMGFSSLMLNEAGDALSYELTVSGLDFGLLLGTGPQTPETGDDVNRIHIHNGVRGEGGPVAFGLFDLVAPEAGGQDADDLMVVDNGDGSVTLTGIWEETDPALIGLSEFVEEIRTTELGEDISLYWNVHTEEFPGGAIRGQLQIGDLGGDDDMMSTQFFALTDDNTLVSFSSDNLEDTSSIAVTGLDGVLLGIDVRPATGEIYGITTANNIYTIDPDTGMAMLESMLDIPFEGGTISGFDFNPVADRLRLVGDNDQDFRINVDTGEVIVDGDLAFAAGDINAGVNPNITAAAYTNSFAGTTSTQLYDIDTLLNDLVLQDPPNDGTLVTIGDLGINFDTLGGFDILSSAEGMNQAFAVSNSMLYTIDLSTGMATSLGMIGSDSTLNLQGLVAMDAFSGDDEITGTDGNDSLNGGAGNDTIAGGLGDDLIDGGIGDDVLRGDLNSRDPQDNQMGGNDTIMGGAGNDRIGGKGGNDQLLGGDGDDAIWGDDGDDILRGGLGDDMLTGDNFSGGMGADMFILAMGEGMDTITDFEVGIDMIGLADGLMVEDLTMMSSGGSTMIELGDETLAVIAGVAVEALTEDSFVSM